MTTLLSTNPGLLVWVVIFGIAALVCIIVGALMRRSGVSLKPIKWFAGFMLLIGAPQFLGHLYMAVATVRGDAPRAQALATLAQPGQGEAHADAVRQLFGPDADPRLVVDPRAQFADVLAQAEVARFAAIGTTESVLLARFGGYMDAERAWVQYLRVTGLAKAGGKGNSQAGYVVTRPAGDRLYALHMANMLGVWTGPDDAAIRSRMRAGGFEPPRDSPLAGASPAIQASGASSGTTAPALDLGPLGIPVIAAGLLAYTLLVVLYFFKGAAWAGSVPAQPGAAAIGAGELARRLEAINALDIPFRIEHEPGGTSLIATWRYADAKWIDHARAHGLRRTHRICMQLDEAARVVRATDFHAAYDWSAGGRGTNIQWKSGMGITFFQREQQRVFGLQLDAQGRFKPALSYSYRFDLHEMKSPLIEAVTRAGWTWRPVLWQGPAWLRWLTG